MIKLYSFLFACSFAILAASQTPGSLDTSFDSDGIVEFGFGAGDDNVRDVKVLSDNKVLMLAYVNPASQGATLVKLNEDGSLDNSFGTNGVFQFNQIDGTLNLSALAIDSQGRIIVAGELGVYPDNDIAVVRLTPNGDADNTFGNGGLYTVNITSTYEGLGGVTIAADDRIVACGASYFDSELDTEMMIVYIDNDGTLYDVFNGSGIWISNDDSTSNFLYDVEMMADGSIISGGVSNVGFVSSMMACHVLLNGELDQNFGASGIAIFNLSDGGSIAHGTALQSDGKLLLGGLIFGANQPDTAILRLNTDGSLDTTFSSDGIFTMALGADSDMVWDLAIQNNGKIIAVGSANFTSNQSAYILRLLTNGNLDVTFGSAGMTYTEVDYYSRAYAVALAPNGKIVVGGASYGNIKGPDFNCFVSRYFGDTTIDISESLASTMVSLVYPNPSTSVCYFKKVDARIDNAIYDLLGNLIYISRGEPSIDVSGFAPGIYYIKTTSLDGNESSSCKLTIAR